MNIDSITLSKLRGIDILTVADELGIGLRHRTALCVNHDDSHPSLHFWPGTNTCHCFSCGWGGDVIDLVMKRENLSFVEACLWLGRRFGIPVGGTSSDGKVSSRDASDAKSPGRRPWIRLASNEESVNGKLEIQLDSNRKRILHSNDSSSKGNLSCQGRSLKPRSGISLRGEYEHHPDTLFLGKMLEGMRLTERAKEFLFEQRKLLPQYLLWSRVVATDVDMSGYRFGGKFFDGPSLLIPYFDVSGRLLTVQSRYLGTDKDKPRFKFAPGSKPLVYGLQILPQVKEGEVLVVTEGCTDCWAAMSMGYKAIAIPSATLCNAECQQLLAGKNLHMWPDQDEPGHKLYMQLHEMLPQLEYHQLPSDCKDLSEYYLKRKVAQSQ